MSVAPSEKIMVFGDFANAAFFRQLTTGMILSLRVMTSTGITPKIGKDNSYLFLR